MYSARGPARLIASTDMNHHALRTATIALGIGLSIGLVAACSPSPTAPNAATPVATPAVHSGGETATASAPAESVADQDFPDVLAAELTGNGNGFTISVTISSPYDTPERYADGWRVLTQDGAVLAEHTLGHDHASEQPFTRTSASFTIPADVTAVVVEGRDQANGYGGETVTVSVPR